MSCSAWQTWHFKCFFNIVPENYRYWSQPHQRPISIVEFVSFLTEIRLPVEKLFNRYLYVTTQTYRMFPPSIAQPIENPEHEHVPDMFGHKLSLVVYQGSSHSEGHATIISPNAYSSWSGFKKTAFDGINNIIETIFNDIQTLRLVRYKFCACTQSITNSKTK